MKEMRGRCSDFIKNTTTPIKREHSKDINKYIENFIKFPGGVSIISIFFVSSQIVKNQTLAIVGMVLIILSLWFALNLLREIIIEDGKFYNKIIEIEMPMVIFGDKMTKFSRGECSESELLGVFKKLKESYGDNDKLETKDINFIYSEINISFILLSLGMIISFISIIFC